MASKKAGKSSKVMSKKTLKKTKGGLNFASPSSRFTESVTNKVVENPTTKLAGDVNGSITV